MANTIFLTGGTGFLGTELAARLIRVPETVTYVLVRAADEAEACHRVRAAWHHQKDLYQKIGTQMVPVPGDFSRPDLGISAKDRENFLNTVTHVIHAGAEIGF